MKLLYNSGVFSIEGITVINPEVLQLSLHEWHTNDQPERIKDGESFDLPDNIIAEMEYEKYDGEGRWLHCTKTQFEMMDSSYISKREVYRLKLKEPLVHSIRCAAYTNDGLQKRGHIPGECNCKEPLEDTGSKETQEEVHEMIAKVHEDIGGRYELDSYDKGVIHALLCKLQK